MGSVILPIALGGSIIAPNGLDLEWLGSLRDQLPPLLDEVGAQAIVVTGGGLIARRYQKALGGLLRKAPPECLDRIGVAATRLNGQLLRAMFGTKCRDPLITDPTTAPPPTGLLAVASGWKPGFSTDYVAVRLAERFGMQTVVVLSNIDRVYSADPQVVPDSKPLDRIGWTELRRLVGTVWRPGSNLPLDPVAAQRASELQLRVVIAGKALDNLARLLRGEPFVGTIIEV